MVGERGECTVPRQKIWDVRTGYIPGLPCLEKITGAGVSRGNNGNLGGHESGGGNRDMIDGAPGIGGRRRGYFVSDGIGGRSSIGGGQSWGARCIESDLTRVGGLPLAGLRDVLGHRLPGGHI